MVDVAVCRLWIAADGYRHQSTQGIAIACRITPWPEPGAVGGPTYGGFCCYLHVIFGASSRGRPGEASLSVVDRRRWIPPPGRSRDSSCLEDRAPARAQGRRFGVHPGDPAEGDIRCVERFSAHRGF